MRTLPVVTYCSSRAGSLVRAKARQAGHWKSDHSEITTGALGSPLERRSAPCPPTVLAVAEILGVWATEIRSRTITPVPRRRPSTEASPNMRYQCGGSKGAPEEGPLPRAPRAFCPVGWGGLRRFVRSTLSLFPVIYPRDSCRSRSRITLSG